MLPAEQARAPADHEAEDLRRPRASARARRRRSPSDVRRSEPRQYLGTGKRKTSVARVILRPGDGKTWINGKTIEDYFPRLVHRKVVMAPLEVTELAGPVRPARARPRRRAVRPGRRGAARHRPRARRGQSGLPRPPQAPGLPDAGRPPGRAQEGRPAQGAQGAAVLEALDASPWLAARPATVRHADRRVTSRLPPMASAYFGTDGVRGVVGEFLTADLVERLGRAATLWSGAQRVFVGRDTRGSGPELEAALARGDRLGRRRWRCSAACCRRRRSRSLALDLGVVISASHNPPEYNGVKFFDARGRKLTDATRRRSRRCSTRRRSRERGEVEHDDGAADCYLDYVLEHFGSDLDGPAHRASTARTARTPASRRARSSGSAPRCTRSATSPTARTSTSAAARPTRRCSQQPSRSGGFDLGIAFDGDGDRMLAVDERGELVDGDGIVAILALDLGVDLVAVTQMTNHGFHALMREHGIRVRHDRRRRPLRARGARARGRRARRRAVGPHHLPARPRHRRRARGGAAALRRAAAAARSSEAAARDAALRAAQGEHPVSSKELTPAIRAAVDASTPSSTAPAACSSGPPGTEPLIRVLVEAENEEVAEKPVLASRRSSRVSSADRFRQLEY